MIKLRCTRYEGGRSGYNYGTVVSEKNRDDAILQLLKFELGYGGNIVNVDIDDPEKVRLEIETHVISKLDIVEFIGSMAEMKPLLHLAYIHTHLMRPGAVRDTVVKNCADTAISDGLNLPIHLSLIAPLWMGGSSTRMTCIVFCAEQRETGWEEKDFEVFKDIDLDTLISFVQLIADGCTLEECLEIAS
jgi:hypothetical protein